MQFVEIKEKNKLNDFVGTQEHSELLQSWQWGEFQERSGAKVLRFGVEDGGKIIAAVTLVEKSLPLGMKYLYAPRGPVLNTELRISNSELSNYVFSEIRKATKEERIVFLRIEPKETVQSSEFKIQNSIDIQVSKTIVLDLRKTEEELLKEMHQKTRYNIRLAEKKGVLIREAGVEEFDRFWELMSATVNRDGFRLHEKEYYKKMLQSENIKLLFGTFEDKILCAGIFSFFGDTATYLHGASSNENRELMAPHLLQWEMTRKAKADGYRYYDFFGIDEKKWPGVTRFKRGFGGQVLNYPGTFDVLFDEGRHKIYVFLRLIRRMLKF